MDEDIKIRTLLAMILCAIATGWFLASSIAGIRKGASKPVPAPVLTQAEANDLLFMREEEKVAHDDYITVYAVWGGRVFDNISQAEQRHMDAILGLKKYDLEDPVLDFGFFANPELQALYTKLIARGMQSRLDALMVGALIEEVDMDDMVTAMERTSKTDILTVYGNLLAGSKNHLRAFVRNIETITGEPYVAQYFPGRG